MARKPVTDMSAWPSLTLEGNLIAPAMVASIDRRQASDQSEEDYRIRKGLTIREEISTSFRVGQSHFDAFMKLQNPSVEATRRFVRAFLAETFGFDDLAPADGTLLFLAGGRVPVVVVPPSEEKLDRRSPTLSIDRSRSPAFALQDYLNDHDDALWGLVTNGTFLRLMRDNASLTRPAYIEADLAQIFTNEDAASFAVLWSLIHRTRFGAAGAPATDCALERWRDAGSREGEAARDRLAAQVEIALRVLGSGFLEANPDLATRLKSGEIDLTEWFNELLRLVYRLIFLMVAEDRNLLHPETATQDARKLYREGYSLAALRASCVRAAVWDKHHDRYEGVKIVFRALAHGQDALGLPALGGLFSDDKLPHLETARLRNRAFMEALYRLSWLSDKAGMTPVNWRAMETEELGSVYESLLELQPQLGEDGRTLHFASEAVEQKGNQRKITGSYYTPDSLVQLLLDTTLDPVLDEREAQAADPAEALLDLTVIDPACGSGHFLLAAARRIATRVARHRTGGVPSAADFRHALRDVACRCLYGVDRNPMAVELTKVALWIEALEPGRPLAFFDAQIRCGDSLIGVFDRAMLREGLPDEAYKPLTGDDKELSRRYARLNREQRERAKGLPQLFKNWSPPEILADRDHKLKAMAQDDLASVEAKASDFQAIRASVAWQNLKTASDLYVSANFYMAAFFTAKAGAAGGTDAMPLTEHVWQAAGGQTPAEHLNNGATLTSEKVSAFHWFIEFPEIMERDGGFDAVIGNPPWEVSQLSEKEFFATRAPAIASLSGDERKNTIERLEIENPRLWRDYILAKRAPEAANEFFRSSGRFSSTAIGKLNTYSLFAELFLRLTKPGGRAGVIVPTGIATDSSTSLFFGNLVTHQRLVQLIDFENREAIFPSVHRSYKFSILSMGSADRASFAFFLTNTAQFAEDERRFTLTPDEIARINPNTKTAPVFRSLADADLTAKLYARTPVLIQERSQGSGVDINPWGISFRQGLFNMTSESSFFRTPMQMEVDGWQRDGANWMRESAIGVERRVPLYEAKMIHHFDHRWATYGAGASDDEESARDCTLAEKQNPHFEPSPRYWVPEEEVALRAARVPSSLKSAVRQGRGEGGKGRRKADADAQEGGRAVALKVLVTWLAGAFPILEGRSAREADIFRLLGRAQDYRSALKASPERFLLDPKTLAAGADMQRETPLTADDLSLITEGEKDALAVAEVLIAAKQPRWLMGWRDICRSTDERTVIASVFPKIGVGHTMPIFNLNEGADFAAAHLAMWLSLTFDFIARLSVGGTHLTYSYLKQFVALPPSAFSKNDLNFIRPRVLELTYTSHAMKLWAEDLGYSGQPFAWNDDRRAQLRAELDVFFARKYGLTDEELRYVLDPAKVKGADYPSETFRVLKEKETRLYGEYRTERLVLDAWKQTAAGAAPVALPASIIPPSPVDLPDGAWARATQQPHDAGAALTAILKTINGPTPRQTVRFAAALILEPHLLTALLSAAQAQEWRRLVGQEAEPRTGNVVGFAARTNQGWGTSVSNHRGNGRLIEDLSAGTWTPGPGLDVFDTAGWPDGRASFALEALRSLDLDSTVSSMPDEVRDWIAHAAAA
ncbi:Eco57I restriction-modification methylase domain-containing protein [Rhizobium multihospitium]|uniref:site-specific DNA-methyltransferase (adenine-specific) n=1 Tax=Rhizobium multihospitium TaxID=410764 RepID=A0A1C3WIP3_9HYPH|nr:N-6 DNA methylase [Rhizobium multihospitium]SCB39942.1 Type II restriction/modification system, DNA methylase subunit YeeA [Rhizobium multihospitium]